MAIQTSIQPFTLWRNVGFGLLCLVFALWGWYDYEYKIPRLQVDSEAYETAKATRGELELAAEKAPLSDEQVKRMDAAKATLADIKARYGNGVPTKPAAYDRPMQLWLYIVGCGVMGVPMFAWPLLRTSMRPYRLDDKGVLHTPDGVYGPEEIVDIDMSRWCSPTGDRRSTWTAKAILKSGKTVLLDDHDHKGMHLIIGAIANRFYPGQWTPEARRVEANQASGTDAPAPSAQA
jgi:hypothetical protein